MIENQFSYPSFSLFGVKTQHMLSSLHHRINCAICVSPNSELSSRVQKALIGLIHNKVRNQKSALKVNICVSVQQSVALLTKTNRLKQSGPQLFDLYHTVTKTIFRLKKCQNSNICKIFPRSEGALKISFWKSKVDFASVCSVRSAVKRNTLYVFRIKINFKKC